MTPTGSVAVTVAGPGGYTWSGTQDVSGSPTTLTTDRLLEPGFYSVSTLYSPDAGSAFKPSAASSGFFVADRSKDSRVPVLN